MQNTPPPRVEKQTNMLKRTCVPLPRVEEEKQKQVQTQHVCMSEYTSQSTQNQQPRVIADSFALNQPATSHHGVKLRSHTPSMSNKPNFIPLDHYMAPPSNTPINNYTTNNYPTSQTKIYPHLIPPDSTPYSSQATNFKNITVNDIVANHLIHNHAVHHVFHKITGERETMDTLLKGKHGRGWTQSLSNEWDRLGDGQLGKVKDTNTIQFILKEAVPVGRKATYGNFFCDHIPPKTESIRVRLTVGGDKLDYPFEASSPASSLIDAKLILNSTIYDANQGAKFMTANLKDFF